MNLKEYLRSGHTDNNGVHHEWSNFDLELLPSVGCVINNKNGDTFPLLSNGDIDFSDGGTHIHDIENEEWFDTLSTEDLDIIEDILGNPTDTLLDDTEAEYLEHKILTQMGV